MNRCTEKKRKWKANKSKSVSNRGAIHECCDIQDHSLDSSCNQKRWRTFRVDHFLFNYLNKTEKKHNYSSRLKEEEENIRQTETYYIISQFQRACERSSIPHGVTIVEVVIFPRPHPPFLYLKVQTWASVVASHSRARNLVTIQNQPETVNRHS